MSTKKRKTIVGRETFIPGEVTMTTDEFFKELQAANVIAMELQSAVRQLGLTPTQITQLIQLVVKRNATGLYSKIEIEYFPKIVWREGPCPVAVATIGFQIEGDDKDPMDAFAINDLIQDLAPCMMSKEGPNKMREHLKTKFTKRASIDNNKTPN